MKIVTKTTFVIGKNKLVGPGVEINIKDDEEAQSLIDRGLAELPVDETAFVIGKNKLVGPGIEIDIKDDEEAQSLIDRGLADLPVDEAAAAIDADTGESA